MANICPVQIFATYLDNGNVIGNIDFLILHSLCNLYFFYILFNL